MARPKLGKGESERLQMVISREELDAIEEWQHLNRIQSKSEAIRRLCQIGLLVESELEQIVDITSDGVKVLSNQSMDQIQLWRAVVNPYTVDVLFGREEMSDVMNMASDQNREATEGVLGIHHLVVTLYNMISDIVQSRTVKAGLRKSQRHIRAAEEYVAQVAREHAQRRENRYIGLLYHYEDPPEEVAAYEALPDEEQEKFLQTRIKQLADEEAADPDAFAKKYGIKPPFWEEAGWATRLRHQTEEKGRRIFLDALERSTAGDEVVSEPGPENEEDAENKS